MHGNAFEWCENWLHDYDKAPANGSAQQEDYGWDRGVLRGGNWGALAGWCRSAYRLRGLPGFRGTVVGFRPASSSL
jgi:formylglycine-generating enzyme required for sulfatase activity